MRVEVRTFGSTGDVAAGTRQVDQRFRQALEARAADHPRFTQIEDLCLGLWLFSNEHKQKARRPGGRFYPKDNSFIITTRISYAAWKDSGWEGRVRAYADAAIVGANAIHKTRSSAEERAAIIALIEAVTAEVQADPPEILAPFDPSGFIDMTSDEPRPEPPPSFRLYRRTDSRRDHHQAYCLPDGLLEIWGECGVEGQAKRHEIADIAQRDALFRSLERDARKAGFRTLQISLHKPLIGTTSGAAPAFKQFLAGQLIAYGLGFCENTISDDPQAFCWVIDAKQAQAVLAPLLAASPFPNATLAPPDWATIAPEAGLSPKPLP